MTGDPPPGWVDNPSLAEENAAAWMRAWGFSDARCTPPGPDGGVDVVSSQALAQVKYEAKNIGAPALQRLVGAAGRQSQKRLFFFTGGDYTRQATLYADGENVALFTYDQRGQMSPRNRTATQVLGEVARERAHERQVAVRPASAHRARSERLFATPSPGPAEPINWHPSGPDVPSTLAGRGWLGRNWLAIAAVFWLVTAVAVGADHLDDPVHDQLVGNSPALLLTAICALMWTLSKKQRERWRRERDEARDRTYKVVSDYYRDR